MNHETTQISKFASLLALQGQLEWDESFDYKAERSRTLTNSTEQKTGQIRPTQADVGRPE